MLIWWLVIRWQLLLLSKIYDLIMLSCFSHNQFFKVFRVVDFVLFHPRSLLLSTTSLSIILHLIIGPPNLVLTIFSTISRWCLHALLNCLILCATTFPNVFFCIWHIFTKNVLSFDLKNNSEVSFVRNFSKKHCLKNYCLLSPHHWSLSTSC